MKIEITPEQYDIKNYSTEDIINDLQIIEEHFGESDKDAIIYKNELARRGVAYTSPQKMNAREIIKNLLVEHFEEKLSGSGIDCSWEANYQSENSRVITLSNSYHCMNNDGYYDGYQDFKIVFPFGDLTDWKLQFTGYRKENYIYLLREYLEDSIQHAVDKFVEIHN